MGSISFGDLWVISMWVRKSPETGDRFLSQSKKSRHQRMSFYAIRETDELRSKDLLVATCKMTDAELLLLTTKVGYADARRGRIYEEWRLIRNNGLAAETGNEVPPKPKHQRRLFRMSQPHETRMIRCATKTESRNDEFAWRSP